MQYHSIPGSLSGVGCLVRGIQTNDRYGAFSGACNFMQAVSSDNFLPSSEQHAYQQPNGNYL